MKHAVNTRQLCFFLAFLMPVSKLLQTPSLLAYYADGDLLFPALCQQLLQGLMLAGLLLFCKRAKRSPFDFLAQTTSPIVARCAYGLLALFYAFFSLLPLLELERFAYTAFFDTAPGISAFAPFFVLSAYFCVKGLKSFARICDLCAPLFLISFFGLLFFAVGEADFSALTPLLKTPSASVGLGVLRSVIHFSDTALLIPLLGSYKYKQGDGKKVLLSYAVGAVFVLIFLAVFYGVFGVLAPLKPYAFDKIAVYFSGLKVIGRVDLLLVYLTSVLLLFYYCLPLQLCTHCFTRAVGLSSPLFVSIGLNLLLFLLTVFFNRFYGALYSFITTTVGWVFPVFAYLLPLLLLALTYLKRRNARENA